MKHRIAKLWKATLAVGGFVAIASLASAEASLPLYEPFNYTADSNLVGQTVNGGTWTRSGANASSPVTIQSSSLSYPGLPAQGGSIQLINANGAEDPGLDITTQTAGTVYASFILNVTNPGTVAGGDYIFNFSSPGTGATDYHARLFVQPGTTTDNFKLGLRFSSSDAILTTGDYAVNTPVFVVVGYTISDSAPNDDYASLWVNPTLGQASPPPAIVTTATGVNDLPNGVGRVNFRQGSASNAQVVQIDELRVSTSWTYVASAPSAGVRDWTLY